MKTEEIKTFLKALGDDFGDEIVLLNGLDEALLGYAERHGLPAVAAYDREKCITVLRSRGMTSAEAEDHFEDHVVGKNEGDRGPMFVSLLRQDKI